MENDKKLRLQEINNTKEMINLLIVFLDEYNMKKGIKYTQYKMPSHVWGKFTKKYNGPDSNFYMCNSYSKEAGVMFGIYENEELASIARGHKNDPRQNYHTLTAAKKKKWILF
ncbi:hypothetical protein [Paenibacillus alvei]|uniref:hypothetical protein n=1 Tax=Paenibacillus alvei TaxID=44250 RepID=UPI0013DD6ED1|nr:hypothetical protein [Paenibacillus alvei]NEZ44370.1 hypothetical protein [Paenibacillus alvei]